MEAEIKVKSDNEIRLKDVNDNILKLRIKDKYGNDTGNYLEFDLLSPEYLLGFQKLVKKDKENRIWLKNQFEIIDRKEDHKGKKIFTYKQEEMLKAWSSFYEKEKEIYDLFLGKGGTDKLLNGRRLSLNTLKEIDDIIEKVILPKLQLNAKDIKKAIMEKYSDKRTDIIE